MEKFLSGYRTIRSAGFRFVRARCRTDSTHVLFAVAPTQIAKVRTWWRRRGLRSDERAGFDSRRQIRTIQRDWLTRNWLRLVPVALIVAAVSLIGRWMLLDPIDDLFVGAFVASVAWPLINKFADMLGLAHKRVGIMAEEQTAACCVGVVGVTAGTLSTTSCWSTAISIT